MTFKRTKSSRFCVLRHSRSDAVTRLFTKKLVWRAENLKEKDLRKQIPKWNKDRPLREADFMPPKERRAFYDERRKANRTGNTITRPGGKNIR